MSDPAHVPAILQKPRRVRYLKIIALFKIFKGVLLFLLGFSIVFLNSRPVWLDQISDWADDQLLLAHSETRIDLNPLGRPRTSQRDVPTSLARDRIPQARELFSRSEVQPRWCKSHLSTR